MVGRLSVTLMVLTVFVGAMVLRRGLDETAPRSAAPARRIVSLAPSVTETLFALGLADRVVGVTRFCAYPAEVATKARVGGLLDPNLEAIVALKPDLVVLLAGDDATEAMLATLEIATLTVDHRDINGILDSILVLGRAGGVVEAAKAIVTDLQARMDRVRQRTAGQPRRRVLFSISRTLGSGAIEDVYVAGDSPYFRRILELAGGENVFAGQRAAFPVVSAEGILHANPDVIVDLVPVVSHRSEPVAESLDDWQQLAGTNAVRDGRVYAMQSDYASVPGPRFILLVEQLAEMLHGRLDDHGHHDGHSGRDES